MSFKSSLQRDLDRFYKALSNSDFNIREVTKSALTQARAKLKPEAFKRLNEVAVETFYRNADYYVWHGMRILAVDGSRLALPNHSTIKKTFGVHGFGPNADSNRSLAVTSLLYDVLNHITIDGEMAAYTCSERELLMKHISKIGNGDLLLLDRGYPCLWLFFLLKAKGVEFCMRIKEDWLQVKDFSESEDQQRIVKFTLPKKDRGKLAEYPEIWTQELECRLIKVELPTGETEILCTSLTDYEKYDISDFKELYNLRWNEEESYKLLKCRGELEKFSGKTDKAVLQDFYAKIFMLTMCAAYAHPIAEKVKEEYKEDQNRKFAQQINRTNALANFMDLIIPAFLKKKVQEALKVFDDLVYKTREIIRPNRSVPRKKKPKRPYHMNYKPL